MKKKKVALIAIVSSFLLVSAVGLTMYMKPPEIQTTNVELDYGEKFDIQKEVMTKDKVISKKVIKGKVHNKKLGEQKITVEVTNKRKISAEKEIIINVIDKKSPVIDVANELTTEAKQEFDIKNHIKASDNVDGNMLNNLIISEFKTDSVMEQKVKISAKDSSQNETIKEITLKVVDTTKPTIQASNKTITEGDNLDLKSGVKATDNLDGDLTKEIEISGNVDKNKAGTYKITYKVKDKSNNETTADITVAVQSKPVPVVVKETSQVSQKASRNSVVQKATSSSRYAPMTLYFNGKSVTYANGGKGSGQSIIDSSRKASTWGGVAVFSGTDGMNTHFIGHNPGNFTGIQNAKSFIITDKNGTPYTYHVTKVYKVNDSAVGINDGVNHWSRITGTGGGERVTFQTCYNDDINWIVEASRQ